ncbi:uncharacterized protein LOC144139993 [Haemaphysalis longicornis]
MAYTKQAGKVLRKHGPFCGYKVPGVITSEANNLVVNFISDDSTEMPGFSATYRKELHPACAHNNGGCKHTCEPNPDGNRTCVCRTGFLLHPDDQDCKEESSVGKLVHFTSLGHANGSVMFSWKWRGGVVPSNLSGFYFKSTAPDHSFLITLPPSSANFTADHLRPYTEYDIALWPFYKPKGATDEALGKPVTLKVRTPASAPTAPAAVTPSPESAWPGPAEPTLTIYGPLAWNCKPVGYRLRMIPSDANGQNERIIQFPDFSAHGEESTYDLNITLSLKPGRSYTVFARACGLGDMGETLVGPETSVTFGTIPLAPVNLRAKITDPTSAMLAWESASPATRYEEEIHSKEE